MAVKGEWIVVDDDVYQRLKDSGRQNETFSDIIRRLLETYEAHTIAKEQVEEQIEPGVPPEPVAGDTQSMSDAEQEGQAAETNNR